MRNLKIGAVVKKKLGIDEGNKGDIRSDKHLDKERRQLNFTSPDDHNRFVKSLYDAVKK